MRRRVKWKNLLLILLGLVILASLAYFIVGYVNDRFIDRQKQNLEEVEPVDNFVLELVDYEVFKTDEEFDFDFVVARLRFKDKEAISYDLSDLYTDEGLKLKDVTKYVSELENKHYYLGSLNVVFSIESDKNNVTYAIFIPVKDKDKTELTLYDALSKGEIKIDLEKNHTDLSSLEYTTGSDIEVSNVKASISDSFISSSIYQNGEAYNYPENISIYSFEIVVSNVLEEGIKIEDAYLKLASGEEVKALDESYTSMKYNNMMAKELKADEKGCLFFEVSKLKDDADRSAELYIKFSNSADYLLLRTELAK